jgi:hypothetical protein
MNKKSDTTKGLNSNQGRVREYFEGLYGRERMELRFMKQIKGLSRKWLEQLGREIVIEELHAFLKSL